MSRTVAVVIPNYNGERILPDCLNALRAQTRQPDEVVVVDNASADGSLALLARDFPEARVLPQRRNHGFAGGVNRGIVATSSDLVAVLNSDARPAPDWLELLLAAPAPEHVWQWGSVLISAEGKVESAADHWDDRGFAYKLGRGMDPADLPAEPYEAFAAPGAAPLMRRDVLDELRGYEERYFLYYEDIDLAYRALLRGYRALVVPAARVEHDLGASGTRRRVRYHVARNSLWTAVRCVPEAMPRAWARRVREELGFNRPLDAELAGRAAAILGLPWALRTRREIQVARSIPPEEVRRRLAPPSGLGAA